jgi:membrane associated rhomboid family serine protease
VNEILRRSWLTLTVFVLTALPSLLQVFFPAVLTSLQRTPAVRDGEVWRLLTSLTVQDGGWFGTISNLLFLLVIGATAERVLPRWLWLACYLAGGVTGELVGLAWQPVGAGNSVAVCGLAGALAVVLIRAVASPRWTPAVVAWWCGALGAMISPMAFIAGMVAAMAVQFAVINLDGTSRRLPLVGRIVGCAVLAYAALLTVLQNIHGPPFLVGAAIALVAYRPARVVDREDS